MTNSGRRKSQDTLIECLFPILNVADVQVSLTYYIETLGFQKDWSTDTLAQVSREGYGIMFNQSTQIHPQEVWIGVEQLEPLYEAFTNQGALIHQEPMNHTWAYDMKVQDPDGHLLWFGAGPKTDMPYED